MKQVKILMTVTDKSCPLPKTSYDGTSAAFDVAASVKTCIPPYSRATVPVGQRFSIPQQEPWYMQVHLRSSYGFKKGLRCHIGIIDAGYTGDFGVSVVNNTEEEIVIDAGDYFAQVLVIEKPQVSFKELSSEEWLVHEANQKRGSGGFGSSGK